ncbi:2-amino-4-hydroxy-6-hydroxymethyldihydropteridine diphosphokinase [Ferrimonas sediminicola]|uniref:2-amino-4-hydroxy-6-hydroxymethyldihydropteridine pyrophosphokinase n=1 Tax=Ferrimonas sediminicola TaxID=2569538 RepID=A0A4U1B9C9_9GAMM|nr:2-amino-4-hydroxy-6-hydroxymethyldihydropteridine diphosphokinase [Ferrimonas sediminicola]TKB47282.1 2-amino-4-hydroxy-6-hydroxymethyldihydropteridine diphosphokinase [Ferrimonas sediminicola]
MTNTDRQDDHQARVRRYYCSFGANLRPKENASYALSWLCEQFHRVTLSGVIATEPEEMVSSLPFINFAFWFDSPLSPQQVKSHFNRQEEKRGRDRSDPLSSIKDRPLDLDILSVDRAPTLATQPDYLVPLLRQLLCNAPLERETVPILLGSLKLGDATSTIYRDTGTGHIRVVDQHP